MEHNEKLELARNLARSFGSMRRAMLRSGDYEGLRQSEYQFLVSLDVLNANYGGSVKISAVCRAIGITQAAATHVLKVLEEGGYVEREPDPADKRISLIRTTELGRKLTASAEDAYLRLFAGLVDHLGMTDSAELQRLLEKAMAVFQQGGKHL
jgi:DNA-binding MarR family transcriptional regulator